MKTVRETIFQFLEVNAPVVALENDVEYLNRDGDYTVLPDGTRQVRNLYQACLKLFETNGDAYGQLIFNEAFHDGPKNVTIGSKVEAKNASKSPLSKDEQHFFEFFTKALEGGIADPLIQEAQQFIAKEVPDSPDAATQIQGVVGDLKKIGVESKNDLKYISTKGLNLKTDHDLTPIGEKFLKELGVKDTQVSIAESSAPLIGQGYNILNDSCVPSKIFDVTEVQTKYGLTIPSIAKIVAVNQTGTFMYNYETTQELVKGRLSHLNVSLNVDYSVFSFSGKAGFNLQADKKSSTKSQEMSYFVEERLFEVNLGNFRDPGLKLTTDFIEDVRTLPAKFQINTEGNRTSFERFFNRWGHFVVTKASGGGSVELKINSSAIKTDSKDIESIRTALTASFSSGFLDVGSNISGGDNSSLAVSGTSLLASSTVIWNGGSRELHKKDTIKDGHAMDQWRNSLTINPAMLSTEMYLEPISTLIRLADSTKYDSTYEALQKFLGGSFKVVVQKEKEAREKREREQKEKEEKEKAESNKRNETTKDPTPKKSCFPLQSHVTIIRAGTEMTEAIKNLKPGDLVLSYDTRNGNQLFSPFIAWLDYSLESTRFKRITLQNGSEVYITDDHLIFESSEKRVTKLAGELKVGDLLMVQNGETSKIVSITHCEKFGFGAPLTAAGTIYVDGVLASCYANLPPEGCRILGVEISAQTIGNIGFGPLKMLRWFQKYQFKMSKADMHPYAQSLIWVYQNILHQKLV
ncbi:uncharacterized protein LOC142344188 [Convolutriloba macropyga]|uniref:uncharacterized protein LOC142344188 n=1 Tax=Convolutriloba macropyga TaxID=536237 RepID=UPI003F51B30C